ncbi:hypothetical protein BKA93DRAFT_809706 [Sparassis latifolia]
MRSRENAGRHSWLVMCPFIQGHAGATQTGTCISAAECWRNLGPAIGVECVHRRRKLKPGWELEPEWELDARCTGRDERRRRAHARLRLACGLCVHGTGRELGLTRGRLGPHTALGGDSNLSTCAGCAGNSLPECYSAACNLSTVCPETRHNTVIHLALAEDVTSGMLDAPLAI